MSDTSPASERKFLPERSKTNTTTEGRKPQLSVLLSEISAVSVNEQCKTSRRYWHVDSLRVEDKYKIILLQTHLKKAGNSQREKLKSL